MVEILWEKYQIKLAIKPPNDIVYNGKKIGGILTESKVQAEMVKCLVIGIGMNTKKMHFNSKIQEIATSIQKEFDITVDNDAILTEFYRQFETKIERRIHR